MGLIPIIVSGKESISGKTVCMGHFLHLTKSVYVDGGLELYCLATLSQNPRSAIEFREI